MNEEELAMLKARLERMQSEKPMSTGDVEVKNPSILDYLADKDATQLKESQDIEGSVFDTPQDAIRRNLTPENMVLGMGIGGLGKEAIGQAATSEAARPLRRGFEQLKTMLSREAPASKAQVKEVLKRPHLDTNQLSTPKQQSAMESFAMDADRQAAEATMKKAAEQGKRGINPEELQALKQIEGELTSTMTPSSDNAPKLKALLESKRNKKK